MDKRATAASAFAVLWTELVSVLGTAAAATLLRRAAKRACLRSADLIELRVERKGWEYQYALPADWSQRSPEESPGFMDLVRSELVPLLREFTGQIVLGRLGRVPGFEQLGFSLEEQK